jgi:hypothetical protein
MIYFLNIFQRAELSYFLICSGTSRISVPHLFGKLYSFTPSHDIIDVFRFDCYNNHINTLRNHPINNQTVETGLSYTSGESCQRNWSENG